MNNKISVLSIAFLVSQATEGMQEMPDTSLDGEIAKQLDRELNEEGARYAPTGRSKGFPSRINLSKEVSKANVYNTFIQSKDEDQTIGGFLHQESMLASRSGTRMSSPVANLDNYQAGLEQDVEDDQYFLDLQKLYGPVRKKLNLNDMDSSCTYPLQFTNSHRQQTQDEGFLVQDDTNKQIDESIFEASKWILNTFYNMDGESNVPSMDFIKASMEFPLHTQETNSYLREELWAYGMEINSTEADNIIKMYFGIE